MGQSDDIKKYLRGNRRGEEANRLERQALSDPFLFEALEGLTQPAVDAMDGLIRLEREIEQQSNTRTKPSWKMFGMVACAIVIVGVAVWVAWPGMHTAHRDGVRHTDSPVVMGDGSFVGDKDMAPAVTIEKEPQSTSHVELPDTDTLLVQTDTMCESKVGKTTVLAARKRGEKMVTDTLFKELSPSAVAALPVERVIRGRVRDSAGQLLAGVTVMPGGKAPRGGTSTNTRGEFEIKVDSSTRVLTFSFIGMKQHRLALNPATDEVNVCMEVDNSRLSESVVASYGSVNRKLVMRAALSDTARFTAALQENIDRFNRFAQAALRYPEEDLKQGRQGIVKLSFDVNRKGVTSRIRVSDSFSKACNAEAIRLLVEGPAWKGVGPKERVYVTIRFTIGKDGGKHAAVLEVDSIQQP